MEVPAKERKTFLLIAAAHRRPSISLSLRYIFEERGSAIKYNVGLVRGKRGGVGDPIFSGFGILISALTLKAFSLK